MPRKPKQTNSGSAELPLGEVWDKQSGPDEYDGRARMRNPDEGDQSSGKWNTAKPKAVVVGRDNIRTPGKSP